MVVNDEYVEIQPNETAFLIALEGQNNSVDKQQKLDSMAYLEANKVPTKRVRIPHLAVDTCPASSGRYCWVDQATHKLIRISRTPVTREWTANPHTGTGGKDESFHVESNESIDFSIGATLTAHISEENTTKFLFYYSGKQLAEVLDGNLRSCVGSELSKAFGSLSVDQARSSKPAIFAKVFDAAKTEFEKRGITLDNFGFSDGMTYSDARIQDAINKKFEADMLKQSAVAQAEAAHNFASAQSAIVAMQELELRKKLVDAQVSMMQKWDGKVPGVLAGDNMFTAMFAAKGAPAASAK
jgi:hypothetical protein